MHYSLYVVLLLIISTQFILINSVRAPVHLMAKVVTPVKKSLSENEQQAVNFFAGGLAGMVSATVTAPLEIVKTQLQASVMTNSNPTAVVKAIWTQDGAAGFFKGIRPLLVGIIPTRAIYFWSYSATKENLSDKLGNGPLNHLASAFAAGITSNTITNPLWMVKTRFQLLADSSKGQQQFKTYGDVVSAIWKEEGFKGFFKGLSASYIGCVEGAIQWMAYEKAKKWVDLRTEERRREGNPNADKLQNFEYFVVAACSKAAAIVATYPHEVVRTRLREQSQLNTFKYKGFVQSLKLIAKEEGRRGLYGGMGLHLLRSVPNAAVMFLTFEVVQKFLAETYTTVAQ